MEEKNRNFLSLKNILCHWTNSSFHAAESGWFKVSIIWHKKSVFWISPESKRLYFYLICAEPWIRPLPFIQQVPSKASKISKIQISSKIMSWYYQKLEKCKLSTLSLECRIDFPWLNIGPKWLKTWKRFIFFSFHTFFGYVRIPIYLFKQPSVSVWLMTFLKLVWCHERVKK